MVVAPWYALGWVAEELSCRGFRKRRRQFIKAIQALLLGLEHCSDFVEVDRVWLLKTDPGGALVLAAHGLSVETWG